MGHGKDDIAFRTIAGHVVHIRLDRCFSRDAICFVCGLKYVRMCCMVALNRCVSYSYDLVTLEIGGQDLKVDQAIDCAYVGSMRWVKCI